MNKLEMFFTVVFIVMIGITMVMVFYYNRRHESEYIDKFVDYEFNGKYDEEPLYAANETFKWNLYDSDINYDYYNFIGYYFWNDENSATKRIEYLRDAYELDDSTLKINMLETMMLIDKYEDEDEIILNVNGSYRINKRNIINFLSDIEYSIETIKQISQIKKELEFSIDNYEIDAKQIFYIMKNAHNLGLFNIKNTSHVFNFASKHKQTTFDAEIIMVDENGISEMNLIIDDSIDGGIFTNESENNSDDVELEKIDIYAGFKKMMEGTKITINSDGQRVVEYPNGEKIIRFNMWEGIAVEDEFENKNRYKKKEKRDFVDVFDDGIDNIMLNNNKQVPFNIDKHKERKIANLNKKEDEPLIQSNTSHFKNKLISINNEFINKANLYDIDNNKVSLVAFFGKVNSIEEFKIKLDSLSDKNIKILSILILSIDAAHIIIDDETTSNLIFNISGEYYISYEYIALILLSLVANRDDFSLNNGIVAKNLLLVFPIKIVDYFVNSVLDDFLFVEKQKHKFIYLTNANQLHLSINVLRISNKSIDLIGLYNSSEKQSSILSTEMIKEEFKALVVAKNSINFKNFIK